MPRKQMQRRYGNSSRAFVIVRCKDPLSVREWGTLVHAALSPFGQNLARHSAMWVVDPDDHDEILTGPNARSGECRFFMPLTAFTQTAVDAVRDVIEECAATTAVATFSKAVFHRGKDV